MNQRELASVLFAVVGAFIAITRILELIFYVGLLAQSSPEAMSPGDSISQRNLATVGLIASLVAILLGSGLILFRHSLAQRLFAASAESLGAREAQAVALSVLGSYFAVQGISRFGWARQFDWTAAIQLLLGVALFFGASGLSGLWMLSRSVGRSRTTREHSA